ncbi:hypothetical protein BX616_011160 [Lobosporangium transversale]|uniref:Aminoglycoside phosphotransferase domain-containing protein n=1 Tax=Lobosporangium transversale TaxID=64571 RepID=A0A1Y2GWB6_9FUNG|nr:hypothetical protein BCR41DRAFT_384173 [Lobosporangium transversale]KAF9909468.1 hypothetical protein BX616_011160 [Lobosporangium transversale]ORZ26555.1 hypothetical protein BCR41DRAFT_384173 [Lobosporangium transversale]|eukprot:XP_021884318.1 hypothetical protein BCR41DRAFT_384173 [Lobosporangium transversale]
MTTAMFKTGMNRSLLNRDFFQVILDRAYGPNKARPKAWSEQELDSSASILSNISSGDQDQDDEIDDFDVDRSSDAPSSFSAQSTAAEAKHSCPRGDMTGHFLYKIEYSSITSDSSTHSSNTLLPDCHSNFYPSINHLPSPQSPLPTSTGSRLGSGLQPGLKPLFSPAAREARAAGELWTVIKSKPIDTALIELTNIMAQLQGGEVAEEYDLVKDLTGFRNSHIREIELAELTWKVGGPMARISTKVYNVLRNDSQQLYALCLEYLDPSHGNITHMNSTEQALAVWSPEHIHLVLRDLASFHAQFLGQENRLMNMSFLENPSRAMMKVLRPAYEAMVKANHRNAPDLFSEFLSQNMLDYLGRSNEYWGILEKSPRTLVHGDFNTRNICLRREPSTGAQALCAYDWELACCHVPQRDVVEFLSFVLPPGSNDWSHYIEYHRLALEASYEIQQRLCQRERDVNAPSAPIVSSPIRIPSSKEYLEVAKIALLDFASLRISMYGISNSFKQVNWLPRIVQSLEEQIKRFGPPRRHQSRILRESKL